MTFSLYLLEILHKKSVKIRPKKNYDKTLYVWSNQFTPVKLFFYTTAGCDG